eukprot:1564429-Amphidinium_carterae.1
MAWNAKESCPRLRAVIGFQTQQKTKQTQQGYKTDKENKQILSARSAKRSRNANIFSTPWDKWCKENQQRFKG